MTTEVVFRQGSGADRPPGATPGAMQREAALKQAVIDGSPDAADVAIALLADTNANVRRTAAQSLGDLGEGGDELMKVLADDREETFVRAATAESLGKLAFVDALPVLVHILEDPKAHRSLRERCLGAISKMPLELTKPALAEALSTVRDPDLLARLIVQFGRLDSDVPLDGFEDLSRHRDPQVRTAVARALGDIARADGVPILLRLATDADSKVRRRSATALATFPNDGGSAALARLVLLDDDENTRQVAASALAELPPSSALIDSTLRVLDEGNLDARSVDLDAVRLAFAASATVSVSDGRSLASALVAHSLGKDRQLVEAIAALLLGVCARNATAAAQMIDDYLGSNPDAEHSLLELRVALGGQKALDPLLRRLQDDLRTYFQQPVAELNSETHRVWIGVLENAQRAFKIRIVMSMTVFVLGALLVVASASVALFGDLDSTAMFGAGTSFVGGLTAMLAVTYRGPLRDIRDAVRDLGSATVLFTGYTHRVLQISHVFSAAYLRGQADLATIERTTRLLEDASRTTSGLLLGSDPHSKTEPGSASSPPARSAPARGSR